MSHSPSHIKLAITEQESAALLDCMRIEKGYLAAIDFQTDKATETITLLLPYFEATSESQPDEQTIYQVIRTLATRLTMINQFIEGAEEENVLSEGIGYQLDRAMAIIELLRAYFEPSCPIEADDKTIYHALSSVLRELSDIQKTVVTYTEENDQA